MDKMTLARIEVKNPYQKLQVELKEGEIMTLAQKFIREFNELPDDKKQEAIDFVELLKERSKTNIEIMMDGIIDENREALEELSK